MHAGLPGRGVDDQVDLPVLDGVRDIGAPLVNLQDWGCRDAVRLEEIPCPVRHSMFGTSWTDGRGRSSLGSKPHAGAFAKRRNVRRTKRGRVVSAPAPWSFPARTGCCCDYSPTGVNVPAFALNRALWNSRLRRAMNFTSTPFGHAAWHS